MMLTRVSPPIAFDATAHSVTTPLMVWAVVLAGGDGTRLAALTVDNAGKQVPKQFWSLTGDQTLLDGAIRRARRVASPERTCVVVAEKHRRHWRKLLPAIDRRNLIVQPRNCGTGIGILLATMHIATRDPFARIVFLPADHHVCDETPLGASMQETAALLPGLPDGIVLLGIEPEGIDCDLGYIVPGPRGEDGARAVARFVEKPDASNAAGLLASGAVWNSFIFASSAQTLINLMRQRFPRTVDDMWNTLISGAEEYVAAGALRNLYQNLLPIDFSHKVLQEAHEILRVVIAPSCGWTDLGTPIRVAKVLRALPDLPRRARQDATSGALTLATQCRRLGVGV